MNATAAIKTRMHSEGHPGSQGKWESHAAMIRLVRELAAMLDEAGAIGDADQTSVDNILYTFEATLPQKVRDSVLHG